MKSSKLTLLVSVISLLLVMSGCSVGMAARTGGVKAEEVTQCQTRQCFLAQDTIELVEARDLPNGEKMEIYRFQLKRGSAGRAAMHGLLDVATLGIWEVAGTPIEASKNKKYLVITAKYRADGSLATTTLGGMPLPEENAALESIELPEGTPVTADGKIVGVLNPQGEFISIEHIMETQKVSEPLPESEPAPEGDKIASESISG